MLAGVQSEALKRLSGAHALLRVIDAHERLLGRGDEATRSGKGMLFVQGYAVYEYVVTEVVRSLVADVNARALQHLQVRTELLSMALDVEFAPMVNVSKRSWEKRIVLLRRVRSADVVEIHENLFPTDGTHFRPGQLETIWSLFGIPHPIVPGPRLRGHITELVEARNRIAHGSDAPDVVGGRFTIAEMQQRLDDTEAVCTHIVGSVTAYVATATCYQ